MNHAPQTRSSLIVRLQSTEDQQAWNEFVEIYEPVVYRLARQRGFQHADACEIAQESLIAVAGAIDRFSTDRSRGSFRGWLFRIARNLMVNFLVRQKRHPVGTGDTNVHKLLEQQPAPDGEDSALFDWECKRQAFRWAAEQIQDGFRTTTWQAFWRTCVEGEPIEDVASDLDMSVGAVYVSRSRVMTRLKAVVEHLDLEGIVHTSPQ